MDSRIFNHTSYNPARYVLSILSSKIIESFLWHLTKDDVFEIGEYPNDNTPLLVERLRFMIDGYLRGYVMAYSRQKTPHSHNIKYVLS